MKLLVCLLSLCVAVSAAAQEGVDPELAAAIAGIRPVDHHAHPRATVGEGEKDPGADALHVEGLAPFDMPLRLRFGNAEHLAALEALWAVPRDAAGNLDLAAVGEAKRKRRLQEGEGYPAWVLDRLGIDVMLANRLEMGRGLAAPRFRWVGFVDALILPLDNAGLKRATPDVEVLLAGVEAQRARQLKDAGFAALPPTLDRYLSGVVDPVLQRFRQGGAVAVKFEVAYFRALDFAAADPAEAAAVYERFRAGGEPPAAEYKKLQDFLFRAVARRAGELGLPVHVHSSAGAGGFYSVSGSNPLLLEPALNDAALRNTRFVLVHGGWPFTREAGSLLYKPNVYADFSLQAFLMPPRELSEVLRSWLSWLPEKVLFGTDAYTYAPLLEWEETGWMWVQASRKALGLALTGMMADGEIDRRRAVELARMVLRDNAVRLYALEAPASAPAP